MNWSKNRVYPGPAGSIVSYFQFPIRAEFPLVQTDRDNESHATCSGPQPATSSLKFVSTSFIKWKIIPANFARPHKWYGLNSNKLCSALSNNWLPCSSWPPVHVCSHSHLSSVERKSWSSFRDFILKILRFVRAITWVKLINCSSSIIWYNSWNGFLNYNQEPLLVTQLYISLSSCFQIFLNIELNIKNFSLTAKRCFALSLSLISNKTN